MGRSRRFVTAVRVGLVIALAGCGRFGFSEVFEREADGAIVRIGDGGPLGDGASPGDGGGDAPAFDCDTTMPDLICPQMTYCQTPVGTCGGPGNCVMPPPLTNLCATAFVCGCDDKTYTSSCAAERSHVSILANGACN